MKYLYLLSQKKILGLLRRFPSSRDPIVVASIGRSGSTMLTRSIRESMDREKIGPLAHFLKGLSKGNGFDLKNTSLQKGLVYKTHALPCELLNDNDPKVVFVFGRASDAVISVAQKGEELGVDWILRHLDNLRASGPFEKVLEEDVLRIEEQIRSWGARDDIDRLMIKYDYIWECQGVIEDFLGLKIKLPKRRKRKNKDRVATFDVGAVRDAYSRLDNFVDSLPGCKILKKGEAI